MFTIIITLISLKKIDLRQQAAGEAVVIAPQTRKRLRAIIKQSKDSLNKWSGATAKDFKKELQQKSPDNKEIDWVENKSEKLIPLTTRLLEEITSNYRPKKSGSKGSQIGKGIGKVETPFQLIFEQCE